MPANPPILVHRRRAPGAAALAAFGLWLAAPVAAQTTTPTPAAVPDPLHGYCAGNNQCVDNGTNSPTNINPPQQFGFTLNGGPASGTLVLDVLVPNNENTGLTSFAIGGTAGTGTATEVNPTAWADNAVINGTNLGTNPALSAYLNAIPTTPNPNPSAPTNPLNAYLPSTQAIDPGATGFFVYQTSLLNVMLEDVSGPNSTPLLSINSNLTGGVLPQASYIVGFFNESGASTWVATNNSGAIFVRRIPEPASLTLLGTVLAGLGGLGWVRRRRKPG